MPSSTHRGLWFTSHGIVLAIGWFGGLVMLDRRSPGGVVNDPPAPPPASHAQVSAAWLEQALAKVREERGKSDSYGDRENLPVPELLKRNRREVAEQQAELTQRLDAIVSASGRYRDLTDPAAAIRDAMKNQSDEATDVALAVFHAWRERDPDAALACLAHTWPLLNDWDATPALLERGFGRDWMVQQLRDATAPYRLRRTIARGLGILLARDGGLAGFINCYQTVTDPVMRDILWSRFTDEWPLEDPREVACVLTNNCPPDVRAKLLATWAPPEGGIADFPYHAPHAPWHMSVEWFKQVRASLDPALVPAAIRANKCKPWWLERPAEPNPEPASLAGLIKNYITSGDSQAKATVRALSRMAERAIQQNPGLAARYVRGEATRQALLEQLRADIPGADAYPEALELAAWSATAARSEPRQLMAWAAELPKLDDFQALFLEAVAPDYRSGDPRHVCLLERYQIIMPAVTEPKTADGIRAKQRNAWENWRDLTPRRALAWRDALPPADPLRAQLADPKSPD